MGVSCCQALESVCQFFSRGSFLNRTEELLSSCRWLRQSLPLLDLLSKQTMNTLKGLVAYSCFSSAYFPSELKVLFGDVPLLTLTWSDHSRNVNWFLLLLKCSVWLPCVHSQAAACWLCFLSCVFPFHPDSPSFIFVFMFWFLKGKKRHLWWKR